MVQLPRRPLRFDRGITDTARRVVDAAADGFSLSAASISGSESPDFDGMVSRLASRLADRAGAADPVPPCEVDLFAEGFSIFGGGVWPSENKLPVKQSRSIYSVKLL